MPWLQFHPAGVEQHISWSEVREIVAHLEIVHPGISRNNFLQQFAQPWDIPLPVAQRINQTSFRFFRAHPESPIERRIRGRDL